MGYGKDLQFALRLDLEEGLSESECNLVDYLSSSSPALIIAIRWEEKMRILFPDPLKCNT